MLNVKKNLESGVSSGMRITSENDRKLIDSMTRGNMVKAPVLFNELVCTINNSNGKILKYCLQNNLIVYFDSTGRYISDYKAAYEKPNLDLLNEEVKEIKPSKKTEKLNKRTVMYRGCPILQKKASKVASKEEGNIEIPKTTAKVKMYRGVPVLT